MKILIDTHVFLWAISKPEKIDKRYRTELETAANIIYVSSISVVELMIKSSIGKLQIDFDPVDIARQSGFELLDFSAQDAIPLQNMSFHHKDPFDRMIIAQSMARNIPVMTNDRKFSQYDCKLI